MKITVIVSEVAAIASAASLLDRLVHTACITVNVATATATLPTNATTNGIPNGNAALPQIITQYVANCRSLPRYRSRFRFIISTMYCNASLAYRFGVVDDAVQVAIMRAAAAPRRDGRDRHNTRPLVKS